MGTQAAFVLGLLAGIVIYWFIYRIYWQRWSASQQRDMAYSQEKVKSALYTNFGLERQVNALKVELAGLRTKITDLEREHRQAQAKAAAANEEKEALVSHLEILRVELAVYKKLAAEPTQPAPPAAQPANGKTHQPVIQPEQVMIPVNGSLGRKTEAPKPIHSNGKAKSHLPPEPFIEPEIVISRPRMDGDRLEIIQGISPAIVKKLRQEGIDSFLALSRLSAEEFKKIIGTRAARLIDVESVMEQAKQLARDRKSDR